MNINGREVDISSFLFKDFDKLLEDIRQEYNRVKAHNIDLRKQLAEWNKDEEIQKANKLAAFYRGHSLHELSDKEAKRIADFRKSHYASCKNAGTFLFELAGTGIGEAISIKCPVCGVEENVTDYDNW